MPDNQQEKINARLKQIRLRLKLNQLEFADLVKIKQSQVSAIESGRRNITAAIKIKLEDNLKANRHWLETGSGEMFLQGGENNPDKPDYKHRSSRHSANADGNNFVAEPDNEYIVTEIYEPESMANDLERYLSPEQMPIPVYDNADITENIAELLENEDIKPVILMLKGHLGCKLVIRHNDKAMDKDFTPPCQLGIRPIANFKNRIIPGMAAVIELEDYTVTRYVFEGSNKTEYVLRSAEPQAFPDMRVGVDEIKRMWKIKSVTPVVDPKILMY